jgi:hypothetical protein
MMSPVVVKMLTDVYRVDIPRQIEHQRNVENAGGGRGSLRWPPCS